MSNIKRAVVYSAASKYIFTIINLASIVLFSRLLTPSEIGVHVVAIAIAALATEVRMLGTGGFLIRKDEVVQNDSRNVVFVTMIVSYPLGVVLALASNAIERFYSIDGLANVLCILSIGFIFAPFISVTSSLFARELRHDLIMFANLTSTIVTFVTTLLFIYYKFSFLSLALGIIIGQSSKVIFYYLYRPVNSSWKPLAKGCKNVFSFGVYVAQTSLLRKLSETSPEMIIGKIGGAYPAAMFSRSMGLFNFTYDLITKAIQPVVLPYLSNTKRSKAQPNNSYLKAISYLSVIVMPMLAVLMVASESAIRLMFGEQWIESAKIVPILCLVGSIRLLVNWSGSLFIAKNLEKVSYFKQIFITIITVISCYYGLQFGLTYLAWALVFATSIDTLLITILLKIKCNLSIKALAKSHITSVVIAIICWACTVGIDYVVEFSQTPPIFVLLLLLAILPIVWYSGIAFFRHPIKAEFDNTIKLLAKKLVKEGHK